MLTKKLHLPRDIVFWEKFVIGGDLNWKTLGMSDVFFNLGKLINLNKRFCIDDLKYALHYKPWRSSWQLTKGNNWEHMETEKLLLLNPRY